MKTVKVRIAVAVDPDGEWYGVGTGDSSSDEINWRDMDCAIDGVGDREARYWLTAELPIPEVETMAADVEKAE